jgi:hypothetical protein
MRVWKRKFWKCSEETRTFEISRAFRASEKLLRNIASSNAHLEYEESVNVRAARKNASVRKCALGSERSTRE